MPSAREIAGQLREQLFAERTFELPLHGYESVYHVRYRGLSYGELRKIGTANEKGLAGVEKELADAADTLIQACVGFVDVSGDHPQELDARWSAATARDLFGANVPDGARARAAIRTVLPELSLMLHFAAYDEKLGETTRTVDEETAGESEAA